MFAEAAKHKGESLWQDAWRRLKANRAARCALVFLAVFGLTALLAPALPIPSPVTLDLQLEPQPPVAPWTSFGDHGFEPDYWDLSAPDRALVALRQAVFGDWQTGPWMGTDAKGRDILARIVWGSRTSILVALAAALCSLAIGVTYGALSGYLGGRVDNLMMRVVDILYSIPFIFLVIFLITIVNEYRIELEDNFGIDREVVFYVVIGAIYWLTMARVVRGQVLALRKAEFIEAARVQGASTRRILFLHLVPNVLSVVIVYLTLTIPAVMLFEAFLSFLGLGIEPPKVSWGLLAVDGSESINPIRIYWWLIVFPAAAMGATLLALNVLGDGLRDALDPKLRGKD
ncbi:MAG: ABC transporter permease [Planctomycetes bacterium]|nr:ABC transporter permease [Planctomycetota bacterium]MCB9905581.1 ABC transporter permease [Planctomycetota bacterium]